MEHARPGPDRLVAGMGSIVGLYSARFRERDECGGLPSGKSAELFRPFEQCGTDRTGVGLGLSISKRAVEANGGTLTVRDLPGLGCVFTVNLPRLHC